MYDLAIGLSQHDRANIGQLNIAHEVSCFYPIAWPVGRAGLKEESGCPVLDEGLTRKYEKRKANDEDERHRDHVDTHDAESKDHSEKYDGPTSDPSDHRTRVLIDIFEISELPSNSSSGVAGNDDAHTNSDYREHKIPERSGTRIEDLVETIHSAHS